MHKMESMMFSEKNGNVTKFNDNPDFVEIAIFSQKSGIPTGGPVLFVMILTCNSPRVS